MIGLGPVPDAQPGTGAGGLGLDEITARPLPFKCMGRSYRAARSDGAVVIQDVTDITRPFPLGRAEPCSESLWSVHTPQGLLAGRTGGTLHAIAVLREAAWPSHDPSPALTGGPDPV
ncbi:hypothetical protein AMK16_03690 [Streptomyces sp. CB00455]|uniref:hypothetical protein n=1 Tax=Streptomyces sp. CB00455 TaxID=1703927 RepID=UPI0009404ED6|nr:hypothetical protein [Streptomyces sp. CB00455]OKK22277.1 hypothetical protein AMK16_03690 [Streptomyces sp. CB00455]